MRHRRSKASPKKSDFYQTNFNELINYNKELYEFVGVVLDRTGPYRTEFAQDYAVKLKLIDHTFNPASNSHGILQPYVMVFLYFKSVEEAQKIDCAIGDLFFGRNFNIRINEYFEMRYVIAKMRPLISTWCFYSPGGYHFLEDENSVEDQLSEWGSRIDISAILDWRKPFFSSIPLQALCWREFPKKSFQALTANPDLLLQFLNWTWFGTAVLRNNNNEIFISEIKAPKMSFEDKAIYKFRSVTVSNIERKAFYEVKLEEFSAVIKVPKFSKSVESFLTLPIPGEITYLLEVSNKIQNQRANLPILNDCKRKSKAPSRQSKRVQKTTKKCTIPKPLPELKNYDLTTLKNDSNSKRNNYNIASVVKRIFKNLCANEDVDKLISNKFWINNDKKCTRVHVTMSNIYTFDLDRSDCVIFEGSFLDSDVQSNNKCYFSVEENDLDELFGTYFKRENCRSHGDGLRKKSKCMECIRESIPAICQPERAYDIIVTRNQSLKYCKSLFQLVDTVLLPCE